MQCSCTSVIDWTCEATRFHEILAGRLAGVNDGLSGYLSSLCDEKTGAHATLLRDTCCRSIKLCSHLR